MQSAQTVTTIWEGLLRLLSLLKRRGKLISTPLSAGCRSRPLLAIQMGGMCSSADDVQCRRIQSSIRASRAGAGVGRLPRAAGAAAHTEGPHTWVHMGLMTGCLNITIFILAVCTFSRLPRSRCLSARFIPASVDKVLVLVLY